MILFILHVELGLQLVNIHQSVRKVCEESLIVCDCVFESVRKNPKKASKLEHILLEIQHGEFGQKLGKVYHNAKNV